jgi:hypothetical protein
MSKVLAEKGVIKLIEEPLTDGSKVFDVMVGPVTFYLPDQRKAKQFYELLIGLDYDAGALTEV